MHNAIQRIGDTVEHRRQSLTNMHKRFIVVNENIALLFPFANSEIVSEMTLAINTKPVSL